MILRHRVMWVVIVLSLGFTIISSKLVDIQLVDHDYYLRRAKALHCRRIIMVAHRGMILDRNNESLAQSQTLYEIRLDSSNVRDPSSTLPMLEKILHLSSGTLARNFNPQARYVLLTKSATEDNWSQLSDFQKETLQAWSALPELKAKKQRAEPFLTATDYPYRAYPNGIHASSLIGFVDANQKGVCGVESVMEKDLAGIPGERWIENDRRGREVVAYRDDDREPKDGLNVVLTIDSSIQNIIEEGLDKIVAKYSPQSVYVVCMQPKTGEILGMGNRPSFDPNNRRGVPLDYFRNHCLTDMVEPGSIFKIVTLSGVLSERLFTLDSPIYCENGRYFYAGKWLNDDEPYGMLTVEQVLANSSNIGFAKMALELGENRLYDYCRLFGFGTSTVMLPHQGETAGILRPVNQWSKLSVTRLPMGQEVGATPIQMVCAMSVIANRGSLMAPHVIKAVTDDSGQIEQSFLPQVIRQVISRDTACEVSKALAAVVTEGTASKVNFPPLHVAGKTGTAQVIVNGTYSKERHVASFIGYLPEENPAFVLLVMVNQPKTKDDYGADVAAPAWADMAGQIAEVMNVRCDDQPPATPEVIQRASL